MSVEAITMALAAPVERSSAKFVLVVMANCANADLTCWPSIQYLADGTAQDRKTVVENVKRLKSDGFIVDTGERRGQTGQVVVYKLNVSKNGTLSPTQEQTQKRNGSETGTVPKTDGNSPVFPCEQSRFSVETVPKTGYGTVKEPSREPSGEPKKEKPQAALVDVDPQVVSDWAAMRKAKKAPITETAIAGVRREAAKAGISMQRALEISVERNWIGFKADWYVEQKQVNGHRHAGPVSKQGALEARNAAVAEQLKGEFSA
jgi:pyocin large subunit-like protein